MKDKIQLTTLLANLEIEALNEMQLAAQVAIADNENVVLLSPTGSGKTLAFLLPVLEQLQTEVKTVQCLIIVPSRELALQIEQVWKKMSTGFKVNVCYGGHSIETELKNLSNPPAVLIGTPGRLNDHLERKSFDTDGVKFLVLDEFDKSLQLGFQDEMMAITAQLYNLQRRILLSATSAIEIPTFTGVVNPLVLNFQKEDVGAGLTVKIVNSPNKDKIETLFNLICSFNSQPAIIFCNHREVSERISDLLNSKGIYSAFYHGGMDQDDRERILIQFRNGSLRYLVTTDLAARGLDIPEMNHVVHYHLPAKESEFTHRNGRTARMHASGTAYIVQHKDDKKLDYVLPEWKELKVSPSHKIPQAPDYVTLYVSGGKKNKLGKGDVAGFFMQKGGLAKEDVGMIEVKDFVTFVAVRASKFKELLGNIKDQKMKGKKYKIETARGVNRDKDKD